MDIKRKMEELKTYVNEVQNIELESREPETQEENQIQDNSIHQVGNQQEKETQSQINFKEYNKIKHKRKDS